MLSEKVTYTHTHKDSIFTFTRNPSKDKTSGTEYRSVGAWDWEWEEDISFKVTRGVFWVMEIFHILVILQPYSGFPGGEVVKNLPANTGDAGDPGSNPWVRKIPRNRKWQPIPVFLPGKFHE